ncbi:type IV pilus biogenesis protein PilM [Acetobacter syzygii]|nr:hypothetical protein [Acetobacter syzygii]NSL92694.1 hypothetical protein [Acetobacter syzygii]
MADTNVLRSIRQQINPLSDEHYPCQIWLAYRTAVIRYVEKHPLVSGQIALSMIGMDDQAHFLSGAGNFVIRNAENVAVLTWMPMSDASITDTIRLSDNDHSIGTSLGNTWETPDFGDMGNLPVYVPSGDIVSEVLLTGTNLHG